MFLSINSIKLKLVKLLLLLLPFHYLFFVILLNDLSFAKYWKDIVFILLIFAHLLCIKNVLEAKVDLTLVTFFFFLIVVVYQLLISDIPLVALYHARIYIFPMILYFVLRNTRISLTNLKSIIRAIFVVAILVSIYGVVQSLFLKSDFLLKIGYPTLSNGQLSHVFFLSGISGFQRATSTFVYPNTFAFFLSLVFLVSFFNKELVFFKNDKIYYLGNFLILMALFLTFSRSVFLSLAIILFISKLRKINEISTKRLSILMLSISFFVLLTLLFKNVGIFKVVYDYSIRTFTLQDTSAVGHLNSYTHSLEIMKNNWFGTGLGYNGPKALMNFSNPNLTESSYFLMQFEVGIIGAIFYFFIYLSILFYSFKNSKNNTHCTTRNINLTTKYLIIFVLTSYLFLPYIQDIETMFIFWGFLGILDNRSNGVYTNAN
ncbi:O-antigen ligase domain-containing protein [Anoxybacillus flavithermus]|uniref:O-antigen ligase domain-containing protein n=1 Tax=Anoxybacillus flavithermus TaxID=33934 RepID=A0AAX1ZWM5_9BACL|nr:O-antigen ligase domain-containing protein [Anoxybacillus flavithermus]